MTELLGLFFALVIIAAPWIAWAKILSWFFDDEVGILVTFGSLFVGIPMYYAIILKLAEVSVGQ